MSRICAVCRPNFANAASYACTSPIWPTAAAACSSWIACGRVVQPSRLMPSAIAPERHEHDLAAAALQRRDLRRPARDRGVVEAAAVVGDEARADLDDEAPRGRDDVLMAPLRAPSRGAARDGRRTITGARASSAVDPARACAGCASSQSWIANDELAASLAVDRGDREHRALPAIRLDERLRRASRARPRAGGRACSARASAACRAAPRRTFASSLTIARASRTGSASSSKRRDVDDVQQQARALQMAQERWPRPAPSAAPSMRPGMSATTKLRFVVGAHDAEVRRERRERIVGDLRTRRGDRADQRRLAGVGHAEQAHVGEHPQLEPQRPRCSPFFAGRELARRAIGARLEVDVAEAALAALRDQRRCAVGREIGDALAGVGVGDHGADRHAQHDVVGAACRTGRRRARSRRACARWMRA